MRTTLTLDDDIYRMAKALSDQAGISLGKVVSNLSRKGLSGSKKVDDELGLPGFSISEEAPLFGPEDVARGEDEL
jgi:hypothetical protein